jgi:hypothetical protein
MGLRLALVIFAALPFGATAKDLIIEKIVINKSPIQPTFFLYFSASANAGRSEASYHKPGQSYRLGIDNSVEIPVQLTLKDIKERDWATIRLHIDDKDELVTTADAAKKHFGGKFRMANNPSYTLNARGNTSQMFVVDNNFVYQVFWRIE